MPEHIPRPSLRTRWLTAAVSLMSHLDPRRSLATAIGWLIVALSLGLGALVGISAGDMTRDSLLGQGAERASNAAEQWSNGLDALLGQRRQPLSTAASMVPRALELSDATRLAAVFDDLQAAYPELSWIGLADAQGNLIASTPIESGSRNVGAKPWFQEGLKQAWMDASSLESTTPDTQPGSAPGVAGPSGATSSAPDSAVAAAVAAPSAGEHFIVLATPVRDAQAQVLGVVGAHLRWSWVAEAAARLRQRPGLVPGSQALLLDAQSRVLIGPPELAGRPLPVDELRKHQGFATAQPSAGGALRALGWSVLLTWPLADATREADAARLHIVSISLAVGAFAALVGVGLARRLTRRLTDLAAAVRAFEPRVSQRIAVPAGRDEASLLGHAFSELLGSLQAERNALSHLSRELEGRVQARTREVERLAEETRYAAVVRERLRIARDLHDTLAHSMMAMLAQVRVLRKLHAHDPQALAAELGRAEQAARAGLNEARAAITQIRSSSVRDLGLGTALTGAVARFTARTGIEVSYAADEQAASFADARADAVFRMAEEALRNIEQHAAASNVVVMLRDAGKGFIAMTVEDDGVGFDPAAGHPGHYGLVGLREQAQLVGAKLDIVSGAGYGTRLSVVLRSEPDLTS